MDVLVDKSLSVCQQCGLADWKANNTLGCIKREVASRAGEVIVPLCFAVLKPYPASVLCPSLGSPVQKVVGVGPEEAMRMIRGLEHLYCGGRLREMSHFSLKKASGRSHCGLPGLEGTL